MEASLAKILAKSAKISPRNTEERTTGWNARLVELTRAAHNRRSFLVKLIDIHVAISIGKLRVAAKLVTISS